LASARQAAGSALCASTIRQLASANHAYAQDHKGRFVAGAQDFTRNLHRWHGTRARMDEPFDFHRGPLAAYLGQSGEIKNCPQFNPASGSAGYRNFEAGCGGYGYNNEFVGRDERAHIDAAIGAPVEIFAEPARTVMFADAAIGQRVGTFPELFEYSFLDPPLWMGGGHSDPVVHFRHAAHANAVWVDGHGDTQVMSFSRPNIYGLSEAENRELGLGGFGPPDNSLYDRQ
jgi:prepilin-type processing-associated H-X9-DG protein